MPREEPPHGDVGALDERTAVAIEDDVRMGDAHGRQGGQGDAQSRLSGPIVPALWYGEGLTQSC